MHFLGNFPGIFLDCFHIFRRNVKGGDNTSRVTRVNTGQFDMFHNGRDKGVRTIADGVGFTFHSMIQEAINQNRAIRSYAYSRLHITDHVLIVVDNFHSSSSQNIRRANHYGISDLIGDFKGFFYGGGHARFRHGNFQFFHHGAE